MKFRPCIDLRNGRVVQIVGGSLSDDRDEAAIVNFTAERSPGDYARLYRADGLTGGHVISLGPGNQGAVLAALGAWPGGFQYGGGVTPENAAAYLNAGASHVIVTSYVFREGRIDMDRLHRLVRAVGRERLVLDLSCRKRDGAYWVVTDRWRRFTTYRVTAESLSDLAAHCDEFLVHGVDVEGLQAGIETDLVLLLGKASPIPVTYAGGARRLADLDLVFSLGGGRVDLTIGSALDIFGGGVPYRDVVAWNNQRSGPAPTPSGPGAHETDGKKEIE